MPEIVDRIVDDTDFCRKCRGQGYLSAAPGEVSPRCRMCGGTGKRSVLILEPADKKETE